MLRCCVIRSPDSSGRNASGRYRSHGSRSQSNRRGEDRQLLAAFIMRARKPPPRLLASLASPCISSVLNPEKKTNRMRSAVRWHNSAPYWARNSLQMAELSLTRRMLQLKPSLRPGANYRAGRCIGIHLRLGAHGNPWLHIHIRRQSNRGETRVKRSGDILRPHLFFAV